MFFFFKKGSFAAETEETKMGVCVETREEFMKMSTEEAKSQRRERSWRRKERKKGTKKICPEEEEGGRKV